MNEPIYRQMPTIFQFRRLPLLLAAALIVSLSAADAPRPAPVLEVLTVDGQPFHLDQYKGKVVVVMFMSTSCPHCHAATQTLNVIHEEAKSRGFEVIGIATNANASEEIGTFVKNFEPTFPVALGSRALWAAFGGFSVMARPPYYPHMLIVDRKGIIREEHNGVERNYYSYQNLNRIFEKYLAEPAS
jgi:peroxiredoxin